MSDNLKNRGPRDAARINVNESWELDYWCRKFGVSSEELRSAVENVGVMAKDIERYLRR